MASLDQAEIATDAEAHEVNREAVHRELQRVITSRHFRTSRRSQQFLKYVVEQKLLGNEASIKERVIGIQVFGRDVNYATGDDPCVRVQAGEVRRRLEAYRAELQQDAEVCIELPIGSYVPVLRMSPSSPGEIGRESSPETTEVPTVPPLADVVAAAVSQEPSGPLHMPEILMPKTVAVHPQPARSLETKIRATVGLVLLIVGLLVGHFVPWSRPGSEAIQQFWGPLLSNQKPVVMSLGRPLVYTPSDALFDKYDQTHPGSFDQLVDRHNKRLDLDSNTTIRWGDLSPKDNSGPAIGGVRAGMALTAFLGRFGKSYTVRFGEEGTFVDFRGSPAIIVSNLNSHWTTDLDNDFPFRIRTTASDDYIEERGTARTWRMTNHPGGMTDYGLITRQPVGITGEYLLKVAGLGDGGSEAAAEVITNPVLLEQVVRTLPPNWEKKNLQILVTTEMIGRKASPPKIIAVHTW